MHAHQRDCVPAGVEGDHCRPRDIGNVWERVAKLVSQLPNALAIWITSWVALKLLIVTLPIVPDVVWPNMKVSFPLPTLIVSAVPT